MRAWTVTRSGRIAGSSAIHKGAQKQFEIFTPSEATDSPNAIEVTLNLVSSPDRGEAIRGPRFGSWSTPSCAMFPFKPISAPSSGWHDRIAVC